MRAVLAYNLYDIPAARIYEYAIIESTWYDTVGEEQRTYQVRVYSTVAVLRYAAISSVIL